MRRKVNQFSDELKFKVVQEYLGTSISKKELMAKYGLRGNSSILNWMRKFGLWSEGLKVWKGIRRMRQGIALTAKPRFGAVVPYFVHPVDF